MSMDKYFTYAYLDIPTRSLISKNNLIFADSSMTGDIQACRHANGRDWWVIKPHFYTDLYYIGLLDPTGIQMQLVQMPGVAHALRTNTFSQFNIQGNKYIQYTNQPLQVIHEYDFDRCTGTLSNLVVHDISDSVADNDFLSALSISPDGSKFYLARNNSSGLVQGFYQVDLATDSMQLIARLGLTPQLMPNGTKLLFNEAYFDSNNVIHQEVSEIENPNAPFHQLQIHHFKYQPPNTILAGAPNTFAYYRLGAEVGTVCDSLLITNNDLKQQRRQRIGMSVYPNPAQSELHIEQTSDGVSTFTISNQLGQALHTWQSSAANQTVHLLELSLPNGLYLLTCHNHRNQQEQLRFVVNR